MKKHVCVFNAILHVKAFKHGMNVPFLMNSEFACNMIAFNFKLDESLDLTEIGEVEMRGKVTFETHHEIIIGSDESHVIDIDKDNLEEAVVQNTDIGAEASVNTDE